jgi:hypothetical protein
MKFEFGINLEAAKQIGVTIPPNRAGKGGSGDSMRLIRPQSKPIGRDDSAEDFGAGDYSD